MDSLAKMNRTPDKSDRIKPHRTQPGKPHPGQAGRLVLTVNGGSSSIKFALFGTKHLRRRTLEGCIAGIGSSNAWFTVKSQNPADNFSRPVVAPDHSTAVQLLMDWAQEKIGPGALAAVGHRVVQGGPRHWRPQRITPGLLRSLRQLSPFDPEHLPAEILLTEALRRRFPRVPQVACFDTAFHHAMPRVAQWVPIPRRFAAQGVRRYGFHGLSCAYLMAELARVAGRQAARGRVILAHLGGGASITAVRGGRSLDTSMGFTPASGLVMGTRAGDLDPGLPAFLARSTGMTLARFQQMVNHESGLRGVSGTSPDMRDLLAREARDVRAAEAVALFCQQAKKWIGALAAVLGGVDTLVFAGGIGENAPLIRARICADLGFLGIKISPPRNRTNTPVISPAAGRVTVRVIRTDEETMIAQSTSSLLKLGPTEKT
jgi:acetate kinase